MMKKLAVLLLCGLAFSASDAPAHEPEFDPQAAWSEFESLFRLFYAYIDREDFSADDVLERGKASALLTEDAAAFRHVVRDMLYAWTDNHLAFGPVEDRYNVVPSGADLIIVRSPDMRFRVQDVRRDSAALAGGVRPGWELVSVTGEPVGPLAASIMRNKVEQVTDKQLSYVATLLANGRPQEERLLVFRTENGEDIEVALPSTAAQIVRVLESPPVTTSMQGDVAVIHINNSLGNNQTIQDFDAALADVIDAPALIVDLRNTPGGGNTEVARSILGHFISETRSYQVHEVPSLEREFTVPRRFIEQVKPREPAYLDRPVVVLGGYWTGSMGEGLVIGFDAATDATIIASDMADLLGGMMNLNLPASGAYMSLGRESLFHVNGTPREDYLADYIIGGADTHLDGSDAGMRMALWKIEQLVGD